MSAWLACNGNIEDQISSGGEAPTRKGNKLAKVMSGAGADGFWKSGREGRSSGEVQEHGRKNLVFDEQSKWNTVGEGELNLWDVRNVKSKVKVVRCERRRQTGFWI
jgi:hypothetical protein